MFDYTGLKSSVNRMITKFGSAATLTVTTRSAYNSVTDAYTETFTSYVIVLVLLEYESKDVDGTLIQVDDKRGMLSAVGLPRIDQLSESQYMIVTQGGRVSSVKGVISTVPGGTSLLYELQLRGS